MKKEWRNLKWIFLGIFIALLVHRPNVLAADDIPTITQDELLERLQSEEKPLILDVRTPEEFQKGHVPGAMNVPHTHLPERIDELDKYKNKDIVIYCRSGRRTGIAAEVLSNAGFTNLLLLEGHMNAWQENKRPIKKP